MEIGKIALEKRFFPNDFWENVKKQLQVLCEAGYSCTLTYLSLVGSECVEIQYSPFEVTDLNNAIATFVTPEEMMYLAKFRESKGNSTNIIN